MFDDKVMSEVTKLTSEKRMLNRELELSKTSYAQSMINGMGQDIREILTSQPQICVMKKSRISRLKAFWKRIKNIF